MIKNLGLNRGIDKRLVGNQVFLTAFTMITSSIAVADVTSQGLPPASNTQRSFVDASIARDSGLNQPLDLLNDFYPAIEVTIADHDNVRRRTDIQEDDLKISVKPTLAYRTNLGRHKFYAAYSGHFTYHDELDEEDATSHNLLARLGLDVSRHWDFNIFGGVGESYEERGVSGSRPFNQFIPGLDSGPDEVDYGFYGADLVYGRKASPLVGTIGFERYKSSYTNNFQGNENTTGGRDRVTDSIHLDLSYKIASKTAIFGRIQRQEIDYDRSLNTLDSEQTDFLIGLRWKPTNALSGVVGIGTTDRDFDDPRRGDYDGSSYYANVDYAYNPFSSFSFRAAKSVEEPGDDLSNFYVSELIGVGWDYAIKPNLLFNVFAKWIEDDYNTDRKDEFFDFGLGLDYVWRPWLTAGIYYGEIERDSSVDLIEYDDRYIGVRLKSDLRTLLRGRGSYTEPESFEYPRPSTRK